MEYGRIIKRSLEITWRNKALWLFGLLLALFGGAQARGAGSGQASSFPSGMSGMGEGFSRDLDGVPWESLPFVRPWTYGAPPWAGFGVDWSAILATMMAVLAVFAVLALVMAVIRVIVRWLSQGALIGMVDEIESGETTTVSAGFSIGWRHLLKLFVINLLIGLAMAIIATVFVFLMLLIGGVFVVPMVLCFTAGDALIVVGVVLAIVLGLIWLLLLIVGSLVLTAIATLVREFSLRACVIDGQGVFDAIGAGLRMLNAKRVESGLMWLLLAAIGFALGLVLIPIVAAVIVLGTALGVAGWAVTEAVWGVLVGLLPVLLVLGLAGLFVGALYIVFESTVWTLTYRELEGSAV